MEFTELEHLQKKSPVVASIYHKLVKKMQEFGPLKIEPKKTSIHVLNRFGFAGIYTRKDSINLEVHLKRKLSSPRIVKVEQASANRYHHTIKLSTLTDVDKELLSWLKEAYDLKA